jgi:hypothetical protein
MEAENQKIKNEEKENLTQRFRKILEIDDKQKNLQEFSFLKGNNNDLFIEFSKLLKEEIEIKCRDKIDKLFVFTKRFEGNEERKPEIGYEEEYSNSEKELNDCAYLYEKYSEALVSDIDRLIYFSRKSYHLCVDNCEDEYVNKKVPDNIIKSCLNGCYKFMLMNREIMNEMLDSSIKDFTNNIGNVSSFKSKISF